MEIALLAVLALLSIAVIALMLSGVPFKVHITHEHIVPPLPPLQQVAETDREREQREKDMKQDIVTALNNYFYDRPDEPTTGGGK